MTNVIRLVPRQLVTPGRGGDDGLGDLVLAWCFFGLALVGITGALGGFFYAAIKIVEGGLCGR